MWTVLNQSSWPSTMAACPEGKAMIAQKAGTALNLAERSWEGARTMTNAAEAIPNRGYHAHIYYDPAMTRPIAERLCAVIGEKFQVEFGGFRDEPVGPHPVANVQVIFKPDQLQPVVERL